MKKHILPIVAMILAFSCTTEEEINTNITSELLANNKLITVSKTEKTATSIGVITHKNYCTTYSFEYEFTVDNNEIDLIFFCRTST